ncbi:MAG: hypothetical protein OXQ94_05155 [Gemmatimonadota bacterium]|nr:hypothetical protein [Gemmatimonadota bacterium]MDE2871063.1 hypothetical protein [Gemmatimonadota bacterium]
MTRKAGPGRVIVALVAYAVALTAVAWRQSTTRETMAEIDRLSRELAVAADEREELARELAGLEARRWVVEAADRRLGLRPPSEAEVVIASGSLR